MRGRGPTPSAPWVAGHVVRAFFGVSFPSGLPSDTVFRVPATVPEKFEYYF